MKMRKKWIGGLFATALISAAFGAFTACGEKIELVGWTGSETDSAVLGDIYRLENTSYKDVDGNIHYCDVTVKDSKGNKVTCIANEFEVLDVGGYTATYSVEVAAGDVRKRTLKIGVTDDSAPTVSVFMPTGFVGETYTIPEITVEDLSGETIVPEYKVYLVDGETKTETAVSNGKFTPTKGGSYELAITAKDKAGNVANVTESFGVRTRPQENILENFDHPSSLANSVNGDGQEWLETFQGKQGVVHIKGTDSDKTAYLFRFIGDAETYRHVPFDSITISLYLTKRADMYPTTEEGTVATWFNGEAGQWLEFTVTEFSDWNYLFSGGTSERGAQLFWSWTKNTDIYIDEIRFSATPKLEFSCNAENNVTKIGEEVSVSATVPTDARLEPWLTVKSPSGQKVKLTDGKFTPTEAGYYTVTASVETAEWSFYDTSETWKILSLGNYVKVGENFVDTDMGSVYSLGTVHEWNTPYTLPAAVLYDPVDKKNLESDIAYAVTFGGETVETANGAFTPDREGVYRITYTASASNGDEYVTECELYVAKTTLAEKQLITFATNGTAENVTYGADGSLPGAQPVWLPEYKGKAGVVKLNDKAKEYGYSIRVNKTYEEVKDLVWEFVDIDIYLEAGEWLNYGIAVQAEQVAGKIEANGNTPWKSGSWTTLSIPKAKMSNPDGFLRAITSSTGGQILWGWDMGNVYIDEIRLRSLSSTLNGFDTQATAAECLNGTNGVGTKATWLESYQGATGVIKTNDGGNMGGYYLRAANHSVAELSAIDWDYIEVKVWVTNGSWVCFKNTSLNVQLVGGQWNTLKIGKSTITAEYGGNISNFYGNLVASTGVQLFWGYDNMGDVYFDSVKLCKNA